MKLEHKMNPSSKKAKEEEILIDVSPLILLYKNGQVKRLPLLDPPPIPPSFDHKTNVQSKDIQISSQTGLKVRLFMPKNQNKNKMPLLLYIHGGGFCLESTFSKKYHYYLNNLASRARVMIVSVEHRRAPEYRLPAAYDDCWDALKWVLSYGHDNSLCIREESEEESLWIRENVDFSRVFLMGDSSGGNIAHHIALRVGNQTATQCGRFINVRFEEGNIIKQNHKKATIAERPLFGDGDESLCQIEGIILVHPYFWGEHRIGDEVAKCKSLHIPDLSNKMWALASPPSRSGLDDPWINPANDPWLHRLGCKRVLVLVAEKDSLRDRGVYYKEALEMSGWKGRVEIVETKREDHVFHLLKPFSSNSVELMRKVVEFLNPTMCKLCGFKNLLDIHYRHINGLFSFR